MIDDGYDLFLTVAPLSDPSSGTMRRITWRTIRNIGTYAEILVDVVAADVIEPWGGGKWHLEIFRSTAADPEDWNGEM